MATGLEVFYLVGNDRAPDGERARASSAAQAVQSEARVPWAVFQELLQEMSTDLDMQERKHVSIPLSLKLCAALRYLATGHSFEGMEDGFEWR